ncbi:hypothetical protein SAMN05444161_4340 [Rhizobiales bacterium GAS191]|nr:hypothetical protein SAMN05444161_4340 [Rhizobiales bacterium GAS191]
MRTNQLIDALVQDQAVAPWRLERSVGLAVVVGSIVAGTLFFLGIGFRPDIGQALETLRFPLKFVVTLSLAVTATGLVLRLARPGAPADLWGWALAVVPVLLALGVVAELLATPAATWASSLVGSNSKVCLTVIPLLATGPLACLLIALRRGAPTRPGLAGAVAGLAASGIAATFYASNCTDDSGLFVATWYPLATGMVVLAGYLIGARCLRW